MPARLKDLARAVKQGWGLRLVKPNSGSHWKFVANDNKTYPVPAHNGERSEIKDEYLRGMCRCFGIDLEELKRLL